MCTKSFGYCWQKAHAVKTETPVKETKLILFVLTDSSSSCLADNTMIECIFFSEFHPEAGPKIACQVRETPILSSATSFYMLHFCDLVYLSNVVKVLILCGLSPICRTNGIVCSCMKLWMCLLLSFYSVLVCCFDLWTQSWTIIYFVCPCVSLSDREPLVSFWPRFRFDPIADANGERVLIGDETWAQLGSMIPLTFAILGWWW